MKKINRWEKIRGFPQVDKCMVSHGTNPKWFGLEGTKDHLIPTLCYEQGTDNLLEYPSRAISVGFKPSLEHVPNASLDFRWLRTNSTLCPSISKCPRAAPFPSEGLEVLTRFICEAGWNPLKNKLGKMQIRSHWEATTLSGAGKGTEVNFESLLIILHSSSSEHFTDFW